MRAELNLQPAEVKGQITVNNTAIAPVAWFGMFRCWLLELYRLTGGFIFAVFLGGGYFDCGFVIAREGN